MKISYKKVIAVIVLIIVVIILYSWFHVSGKEIKGISEMSEDCTAVIRVEDSKIRKGYVEYDLNVIQIEMLKTLILNSSFTKKISSTIYYPAETEMYQIVIDWNNRKDFLSISSTGNEYILLMGQLSGRYLKINNPDWEKELKEIIWISKQN